MPDKKKYVLIDDTLEILSSIAGSKKLIKDKSLLIAIDKYIKTITLNLNNALGSAVDVETISSLIADEELTKRVIDEINKDSDTVCICLDRYLLKEIENTNKYLKNFFRFHICRSTNKNKIPRYKKATFENQFNKLKKAIPNINNNKIILVDDGIFSGGTIKEFMSLLDENNIRSKVKKIIVYTGSYKNTNEFRDSELLVINPLNKLFDWVNIRDFSVFGGNIEQSNDEKSTYFSVPYIFPWSDGSSASLNKSPFFLNFSLNVLESFRKLLEVYEKRVLKQKLTMSQLAENNIPLPLPIDNQPFDLNTSKVEEYLSNCIDKIKSEQDRKLLVFDMDGVLYQLDGKNNGYVGSSLENLIIDNALAYIMSIESKDKVHAKRILAKGLAHPVGLSKYLSLRYGISRENYFNKVWDIDPKLVIKISNVDNLVESFLNLDSNYKPVLISAAPGIWVSKVLKYLNLSDFFELIFSGEQFINKEEIFRILVGRYNPRQSYSIGDDYLSDLKPAEKLGMNTFLISKSNNIQKFIETLKTTT